MAPGAHRHTRSIAQRTICAYAEALCSAASGRMGPRARPGRGTSHYAGQVWLDRRFSDRQGPTPTLQNPLPAQQPVRRKAAPPSHLHRPGTVRSCPRSMRGSSQELPARAAGGPTVPRRDGHQETGHHHQIRAEPVTQHEHRARHQRTGTTHRSGAPVPLCDGWGFAGQEHTIQ
jgi:hypothetical protein